MGKGKEKEIPEKKEEKEIEVGESKGFFDVSAIFGKPFAKPLAKALFKTPVEPWHLTLAGLAFALVAAYFFYFGTAWALVLAAVTVQLKNILDTADNYLARLKGKRSRIQVLADPLADFASSLVIFLAIAANLSRYHNPVLVFPLAGAVFVTMSLQISYKHYCAAVFAREAGEKVKRPLDTEYSELDRKLPTVEYWLTVIFVVIYSWQDNLASSLDNLFLFEETRRQPAKVVKRHWYTSEFFLFLVSFLGLGTQLAALSLFALAGTLYYYLWFVMVAANGYWFFLLLMKADIVRKNKNER